MKLNKIITLATVLSISLLGNIVYAKDGKIKVAFVAGPELSVGEVAKEQAKKQYNLDVEIVEFSDYSTVNQALVDNLIDANAFQHLPFLEEQAKSKGWNNLVPVGNTFTWPLIAYSKKYSNKTEIADGSKVGIPNDPVNQGRALLLLQQEGFVKLKDPKKLTSTIFDIVDNIKNLDIQPIDGALLVSSLNDLDFAIINNTYAAKAKLDPKQALFKDGGDSPYVNLIVAREDNKNDPDIINFVKAFQTEEVYQKALQEFDNFVIKGWE